MSKRFEQIDPRSARLKFPVAEVARLWTHCGNGPKSGDFGYRGMLALSVLVILPIVLGSPLFAAESPGAKNWPLYRGDRQLQGVAHTTLPERPEVLWEFEAEDSAFEAAAVIDSGSVYLGDADGLFYAIDLETGRPRWTFETELGFTAPAAVREGRVYVGDIEGVFFCLDSATGAKLWSFQSEAEINGAPNFYQDQVLFGSQDATLYALDARSGELVWKHQIEDQIRCAPTIAEGHAFLAGCDGRLHIIDLSQGKAIAQVPIGGPTGSTPAALGDRVFFGAESGTFFGINWREARVDWKYQDPRRAQPFRSSAAVTDELVVFGGRDKFVHAVDPQTGELLWTFPTRGRVDSSPVLVGDRLFVGSADGRLYALDKQTGEKRWEYDAGRDFVASPAVAAGRLVIGATDGTLYCFGAKGERSP